MTLEQLKKNKPIMQKIADGEDVTCKNGIGPVKVSVIGGEIKCPFFVKNGGLPANCDNVYKFARDRSCKLLA